MKNKASAKKSCETKRERPIRVGVIGVGRGQSFASGATELIGMKLVALCDTWETKLVLGYGIWVAGLPKVAMDLAIRDLRRRW